MKSAQIKKLKAYRIYEIKQPSIEKARKNERVIRNDWEDYVAQNESDTEIFEPEILIRADESRLLFEDEDRPLDKTYSIVIVSSDQAVNDGAELAWIETGMDSSLKSRKRR
jgi:hypothetical protein